MRCGCLFGDPVAKLMCKSSCLVPKIDKADGNAAALPHAFTYPSGGLTSSGMPPVPWRTHRYWMSAFSSFPGRDGTPLRSFRDETAGGTHDTGNE